MKNISEFEDLLKESMPMIRAMAYSFPERHREDLIQEGILALHKAYTSFDPNMGVSFKVYMRKCVNNRMLTAYKKLKKSDYPKAFDEQMFIGSSSSMEEDIIRKKDAEDFFGNLKKSLSALELSILSEYLKEKSYGEISKTLDLPVKTVDNALARIKKKMRKLR